MNQPNLTKKEDIFVRQQYGRVGSHSVTKVCGWTKRKLRCGESCYKHHFYGISTGKCLEMSPILICNQRCKHCWRDHNLFANKLEGEIDEPEEIVDGCISERRRLLMGFKGSEKTDISVFEDCLIPKQAAISLTGEPCLYPKLPELIEKFYEKEFDSVFLVTNGTVPEMLEKIGKLNRLPTNIYLSVEWWDKESYLEFCKPLEEEQFEKIKQSMDILRELEKEGKTKTVLRITCVNGFNMSNSADGKVKDFQWIVDKMQPTYIECKGYMFVGYSQKRMEKENMPEHSEVKEFSEKLAELMGYTVKGEQEDSRVVLLSKN